MDSNSTNPPNDPITRLPLDETLYSLDEDEYEFYSAETGITDREELRAHILSVQKKAYAVHPYTCLRRFAFLHLKIARLPAYKDLLQLPKDRKDPIFVDVSCCVGNDVRKAVMDGYPLEHIVASDLRPEFWDVGHDLFKSTPESFPLKFLPGDIFDPGFCSVAELGDTQEFQTLRDLPCLSPLVGKVSAIHSSSFFHLFDEDKQSQVAKVFASLLSPEAGSLIFGCHVGRPEKGYRTEQLGRRVTLFCHSPDSWRELWEEKLFPKGTFKVSAGLQEVERRDVESIPGTKFWFIWWSVTRL